MIVAVGSGTTSTRVWVLERGAVKARSGSRSGARALGAWKPFTTEWEAAHAGAPEGRS